jgi:hypothetical protein
MKRDGAAGIVAAGYAAAGHRWYRVKRHLGRDDDFSGLEEIGLEYLLWIRFH